MTRKKGKQIEIDFNSKSTLPVKYNFPHAYLKEAVRKEIAEIIGNPDQMPRNMDTSAIRAKISNVLKSRGLQAEFKDEEVVITEGEKDITGEYYEDWERKRGR